MSALCREADISSVWNFKASPLAVKLSYKRCHSHAIIEVLSNGQAHQLALPAPFWDGNETWLIVVGATLFAAFPYKQRVELLFRFVAHFGFSAAFNACRASSSTIR
jgi:gamma-glutamyl:cysteine ligase YbdK (ATP-grasp superfamily)